MLKPNKAASREREADTYMPYLGHVAPGTVLLNDGSLLAMIAVEGALFETCSDDALAGNLNARNAAFMNVARSGLVLSTHLVRTLSDGAAYPTAQCKSTFARALDEAYRAKITNNRLYENVNFVGVMIRPSAAAALGENFIAALLNRRRRDQRTRVADPAALEALDDTVRTLIASLSLYRPRRLGLRNDDKVAFTEIGEAIRLILTGSRQKVPLVTGHMGASMYSDRIIVGKETVEIRSDAGSNFTAMFGMREYPSTTHAGMLDLLLSAPYRLCLSQTFGFMDKTEALERMTRKANQMDTAGDRSVSQRDALIEAANHVQSNTFVMGDHHLSLAVFADDITRIPAVAAQAKSDLADCGAIIAREDLGLEGAVYAQLPGNMKWRTRPGAISTRNFAALSSLHGYPDGGKKGHWGGPVTTFRTVAGTAYAFHFHPPGSQSEDLGNVFVCGPSGSGKTTKVLFDLAMAERLNAKTVYFDQDRGGEILARAVDGTYLTLPSGAPTGLAPLRALDASPANLQFLKLLITGLIGEDLKPEQDRLLDAALKTVMSLPPEARGLSEVRAFLSNSDPEGPGARLERWCKGGSLGWVLDNDVDEIALESSFIGFDMTAVLDDVTARGPIMSYLFHRVEALLDGQRVVVAIDEFWKALLDENFRDIVKDQLKTIRKNNGVVILATQSPSDALESPIAQAIIQQCPTQIVFPDATADRKVYVDGLKLTPAEFQAVSQGMTGGARRFLVKVTSKESVVCELDLSGLDDLIAVLSGRRATVNLMERLIAANGPASADWLPKFRTQFRSAAA